MKASELRDLPDDELLSRLEGMKEELFNLRFQMATGQLDNPMRVKQVRHDVARVLTVLSGREIEGDLAEQIARTERESLERLRETRGAPVAEAEEEPGPEAGRDEDFDDELGEDELDGDDGGEDADPEDEGRQGEDEER